MTTKSLKAASKGAPKMKGLLTVLVLLGAGCDLVSRTTAPGTVLMIQVDSSAIQADSLSRTRIVAQRTDSSSVDIKLRCDVGRFVEAPAGSPREVTLKAVNGQVFATYVAGIRPGTATILVESGGQSDRRQIELRPARPSSILLTSDRTVAKANGAEAVTLTARLLRPEFAGSVSLGTRVDFVATDSEGRQIDALGGSATMESTDGTTTFKVVSSIPQTVTFNARAAGSAGQVLSNPLRVAFTP